jgi:hypothetical protein
MAEEIKKDVPKVRRHQDSGLEYLRGKYAVLFSNGVKLSPADFDLLKRTPGAVKARLDECLAGEPEKCGWDWKYACSTGNLRLKKGNGNLVENVRTARRRSRQVKEAVEGLDEEQKKAVRRAYFLSSVFLVAVVMAVVGAGSAIMSAYHTSAFLYQGGKPLWASVMTGTMLILFSGTAFTAARYFFQEKGALAVFGWFFVVTGLAVILYSMFSTLTVNFNQFKWKDEEKAAIAVAGSETLAAHGYIIEENRKMLDEANGEITRLEGEVDYWRERTWRRYDDFNARLAAAIERREALRTELARLEAERPVLMERAAVSQETVYSFLARILRLPEDAARFFIYIVPACLYDILAPFALSVVLLLRDKRKNGGVKAA